MNKVWISVAAIVVIVGGYMILGYNSLVNSQEGVNKAWAQVQTVYQRRLDLIPNLVSTVKGYAAHERNTLLAVTKARASVGQLNMSQVTSDPAKFKQFSAAQGQLSSALSRLLVVVERYPNLKASQNFLALQNELEGTENRIAVARQRYNDAAKTFNTSIRKFPRVILANWFHFTRKPYFEASSQAAAAPKVTF